MSPHMYVVDDEYAARVRTMTQQRIDGVTNDTITDYPGTKEQELAELHNLLMIFSQFA